MTRNPLGADIIDPWLPRMDSTMKYIPREDTIFWMDFWKPALASWIESLASATTGSVDILLWDETYPRREYGELRTSIPYKQDIRINNFQTWSVYVFYSLIDSLDTEIAIVEKHILTVVTSHKANKKNNKDYVKLRDESGQDYALAPTNIGINGIMSLYAKQIGTQTYRGSPIYYLLADTV